MHKILNSLEPVVSQSQYVKINQTKIADFCSNFDSHKIDFWLNESPYDYYRLADQARLNFIFIFDSINFCYWGNPKWTIEYQAKKYDGAWGMIAALGKAIDHHLPILDAQYLSILSRQDLSEILEGNTEIPLFDQRLDILRENGKILLAKYDGQFLNVLKQAQGDALSLLDIMTTDFPSYDDSVYYLGQQVFFHKRAQLAICDIYRTYHGQGLGNFSNIDQLTAFADYKIPQSLRKLGILEYNAELATQVDTRTEIPKDSQAEIEIRANALWAVDLIKQNLKTKNPNINAMDIDSYLWLLGQDKSPQDKPYHLTRTIYY